MRKEKYFTKKYFPTVNKIIMYGDHWSWGDVLYIFLILMFIISFVLVWVVVTRRDCTIEQERANVIRAQLLTLLTIATGFVVWLAYRMELKTAVSGLLA